MSQADTKHEVRSTSKVLLSVSPYHRLLPSSELPAPQQLSPPHTSISIFSTGQHIGLHVRDVKVYIGVVCFCVCIGSIICVSVCVCVCVQLCRPTAAEQGHSSTAATNLPEERHLLVGARYRLKGFTPQIA